MAAEINPPANGWPTSRVSVTCSLLSLEGLRPPRCWHLSINLNSTRHIDPGGDYRYSPSLVLGSSPYFSPQDQGCLLWVSALSSPWGRKSKLRRLHSQCSWDWSPGSSTCPPPHGMVLSHSGVTPIPMYGIQPDGICWNPPSQYC